MHDSFAPMLAESVESSDLPSFVFDDRFYFEQKLDGHRILLFSTPGVLVARERHGEISQHNSKFQEYSWDELRLNQQSIVLDGEYIDGVLHLFDLPYVKFGDEILVDLSSPFSWRRSCLEDMFSLGRFCLNVPAKLVPCAKESHQKALLAAECIRSRAEGVMVKRTDGIYLSGKRSLHVLKAKFNKTADLIVTAKGYKGKNNAVLSAYDEDGKLTLVGRCSLIGKPSVDVGDVIEVKYLYMGANGKIVQPTMLTKRIDKLPQECLVSQLVPTNKEVILQDGI